MRLVMAILLVLGSGVPALAHVSTFTDVPVTHPAFAAIDAVTDRGLMQGFPDGSFRPGNPVPKDEERAALVRLVGEARAAQIWPDLKGAKGGRPLARYELAVLLARIASGETIDFKRPLNLDLGLQPTRRDGQSGNAGPPPGGDRPPPPPGGRQPPPRPDGSQPPPRADNGQPPPRPGEAASGGPPRDTVRRIAAVPGNRPCTGVDKIFAPYRKRVAVTCDDRFMYIQSDGMPDHQMMVGIRNSNQQIPLPQDYTGPNAWQIPLKPVAAGRPGKTFDGPVGVAINGVPIFDPTKQGGVGDTKAEGELDVCNGHAGRADDYHYHAAPVCLFKTRPGPSTVVGFALDGYWIDGFVDRAGSQAGLDRCNGSDGADGYRYHVSEAYPYVIGCFHGQADQARQPRTDPVRPPGRPVRGGSITKLAHDPDGWWSQAYTGGPDAHTIRWKQVDRNCWDFDIQGRSGRQQQTYCRR